MSRVNRGLRFFPAARPPFLSCSPTVPRYDLHCHSTHSDGLLAPAAVVARAAARGVDVLALTDHDEVSGLPKRKPRQRTLASSSFAEPSFQ